MNTDNGQKVRRRVWEQTWFRAWTREFSMRMGPSLKMRSSCASTWILSLLLCISGKGATGVTDLIRLFRAPDSFGKDGASEKIV